MKKLFFLSLLLLAVIVSACTDANKTTDTSAPANQGSVGDSPGEGRVCIQVITPAQNSATGECREFPTPCDVPEGWNKVESCDARELAPAKEAVSEQATKTFFLAARQWEWEPSTITVKKGDHVVLNIYNEDVGHGIRIPDFDVNVDLPVKQTTKVEFDATKEGTFTFYCSVYCGSGHSHMTGKLIVGE